MYLGDFLCYYLLHSMLLDLNKLIPIKLELKEFLELIKQSQHLWKDH